MKTTKKKYLRRSTKFEGCEQSEEEPMNLLHTYAIIDGKNNLNL